MPLATTQKNRGGKIIVKRFSDAVKKTATLLDEKVILLIFLIVGILLSFLRLNAWGFFIVFAVYVIMYFINRIAKYGKREKQQKL